jgi:hypothetical protein
VTVQPLYRVRNVLSIGRRRRVPAWPTDQTRGRPGRPFLRFLAKLTGEAEKNEIDMLRIILRLDQNLIYFLLYFIKKPNRPKSHRWQSFRNTPSSLLPINPCTFHFH